MRNEAYTHLQKLLIEARHAAELTQAELALRLGRPQSFVSKYERGERRLDLIEFHELATALQLDPKELFAKFHLEAVHEDRPY